MSSRRAPSGPASFLTGFIVLPLTVITTSTVANATATAVARIAVGPAGTAFANMNGKVMGTNDIVALTPRTLPLNSAGVPVSLQYARVLSVESATVATATAIIEVGLQGSSSGASATAIANTWSMMVALQSADL